MTTTRSNTIIVVHNGEAALAPSVELLRWYYGTICRIPVSVFDLSEPETDPDAPYWRDKCLFIVFLSLNSEPVTASRIEAMDGATPMVFFRDCVKVLYHSSGLSRLLGVRPLHEVKDLVAHVELREHALVRGMRYPVTSDELGHDTRRDLDDFLTIQPLYSDVISVALIRNEPFISLRRDNLYVGQKGVFQPREDLYLEFNRPLYYLRMLDNLLQTLPLAHVRLKPAFWPVSFRIDDLPATADQVISRTRIMTKEDVQLLLQEFESHGARVTLAVTPSFLGRRGAPVPWSATQYSSVKDVIEAIKQGVKAGTAEVACHGLTHVTIGYRPRRASLLGRAITILGRPRTYTEFYDINKKREISVQLQMRDLSLAIEFIESEFGVKPSVVVPPAHNWDSNFEILSGDLGFRYISCDNNFYSYREGASFRKNPSPIGSRAFSDNRLLCVSATLTGTRGSFEESLDLFHELGVPFVWSSHNYAVQLTLEYAKRILSTLDGYADKRYTTISELGDYLTGYHESVLSAQASAKTVDCEVSSRVSVILCWATNPGEDPEVFLDNKSIGRPKGSLSLSPGRHLIQLKHD